MIILLVRAASAGDIMPYHVLEPHNQPFRLCVELSISPELREQVGVEHGHARLRALEWSIVAITHTFFRDRAQSGGGLAV